jgi:hypothetical protein
LKISFLPSLHGRNLLGELCASRNSICKRKLNKKVSPNAHKEIHPGTLGNLSTSLPIKSIPQDLVLMDAKRINKVVFLRRQVLVFPPEETSVT